MLGLNLMYSCSYSLSLGKNNRSIIKGLIVELWSNLSQLIVELWCNHEEEAIKTNTSYWLLINWVGALILF